MDDFLKSIWKRNHADDTFNVEFKALIDDYKSEERSVIRSKIFAVVCMSLTIVYLIVLMLYYDWTSGIKMYGILVVILDMIVVIAMLLLKYKKIEDDPGQFSHKEMIERMITNLQDQIKHNKYVLPLYGLFLVIGLLMTYSDIVPRITDDGLYQSFYYIGVVVFVGILMSIGITRKNKHIRNVVNPLIKDLELMNQNNGNS